MWCSQASESLLICPPFWKVCDFLLLVFTGCNKQAEGLYKTADFDSSRVTLAWVIRCKYFKFLPFFFFTFFFLSFPFCFYSVVYIHMCEDWFINIIIIIIADQLVYCTLFRCIQCFLITDDKKYKDFFFSESISINSIIV